MSSSWRLQLNFCRDGTNWSDAPGGQPRPLATMSLPSDVAQASTLLFFRNKARAKDVNCCGQSAMHERSDGGSLSEAPRAEGIASAEKDFRQPSELGRAVEARRLPGRGRGASSLFIPALPP